MAYPNLFSKISIGALTLENRIIMPLLPTKYAEQSYVTQRMIDFYKARAAGGVALIVLDAPCLDYPDAYKGGQQLRIDGDEFLPSLTRLLEAIRSEGCKAFMHLNHPYEKTVDAKIPGAKQKKGKWVVDRVNVMDEEEIGSIVDLLAHGATLAREIGYDGVELQASYGDLVSRLLSPLTNRRSDRYGGVVGNRARFLCEALHRIKEAAGKDFPVMVKLVCDEFVEGGLHGAEAAEIAKMACAAGADAIVANGGNKDTKRFSIPLHHYPDGPLVNLAANLKTAVDIPVAAIGKIGSPQFAEEVIASGRADLVAMGRALFADPDLPAKAEAGKGGDVRPCLFCVQDCAQGGAPGFGRSCAVNPFTGQEALLDTPRAEVSRMVAVVGGGPAGIQAALTASGRGHRVVLFEKDAVLGGQLRLSHLAPGKGALADALRFLEAQIERSDVEVMTSTRADLGTITALDPDAVIVATGSEPMVPFIKGGNASWVMETRAFYRDLAFTGPKVVVIGGGDVGCETADLLTARGCEVSIVEAEQEVLRTMKDLPRAVLLERLGAKGVRFYKGATVKEISSGEIAVVLEGGEEVLLPADTVIVATGSISQRSLAEALEERDIAVQIAGDAEAVGDLGHALRSGLAAGLKV